MGKICLTTSLYSVPNTYTQLYVHIVFAVKGRQPLIPKQDKAELHRYITGIITNKHAALTGLNTLLSLSLTVLPRTPLRPKEISIPCNTCS